MPISAPSQIGLDILRSPALAGIEAARAERLSRSDAAASQFEVGSTGDAKAPGAADKAATPAGFRRFEAMVLQTFIQNMLPKDGAAVYGKGMAGDMWKSLLAEKVATVMADRGGIGIADRVLGDRYATAAQAAPEAPAAKSLAAPEVDRGASIAPAVVEGMQRSLSQLITDELTASPESERPTDGPTEIQSITERG
ncbi:rod-binding protein [Mesorhizobium sp. KR9-304]|uniref:rod-binding protein n=1 Tax=Mesorhizobium sp. KR9-304 TaxID=3156614 RepID=UPI0032B430BC